MLENVSLKVERGERVAVSGPNGSSKTTLSMLLSGYLEPTKDKVLLDGRAMPKKGLFPVQLVHQHPEKTINPCWRMKKVLEECGDIRWDLLEELGIEGTWLERFPCELSGCELQRFCVARSLMSGADYLICDEISIMLDVITQAQIWNVVLKEAGRRNMGLVVVTHSSRLRERIATRTVELLSGENIL